VSKEKVWSEAAGESAGIDFLIAIHTDLLNSLPLELRDDYKLVVIKLTHH
jgi:hypothetical protein